MQGPFELLGLPCSLTLSEQDIESAWAQAMQSAHPDSGDGDEELSASLNEARAGLSDPLRRLHSWLSEKSDLDSDRKNVGIDPELMDLFAAVNEGLQQADAAIAETKAASTALGKALVAKKAVQAQLGLQSLLGRINQAVGEITDRFSEFEVKAESGDFDFAQKASDRARFLKKWEMQCNDRLVELISL